MVTDKYVIFDSDAFADERVGLYSDAIADGDSLLDLDECPNQAVRAYSTTVEVNKIPHLGIFSDAAVDDTL
jgi:hypothetical protein